MMSKLLDSLYKYIVWLVVGVSIIAYLAYRTIKLDGTIQEMAASPDTWINVAFSIWLHLNILQGGTDSAVTSGLQSQEFSIADTLNNKIIRVINNEMTPFREYVKALNYNERAKLEDDFLFKNGVTSYDELTPKQQKKFKKLKPISHDIYGYNLPLFYELTREGKLSYKANYVKNKGVWGRRATKIITGVLFGGLTINIVFNISGIGEALISVLIMSAGLILTFLMSFIKPYFKLRYEIPKIVIMKSVLYNGYVDYKNGVTKLIELNEIKPVEPKKAEVEQISPETQETPPQA